VSIVAGLIAGGLCDPAWIANFYIERIDPDSRRLPDLINGACAAHVQHIACRQLGIVEPRGSVHAKPVSSIRTKELHDALDALRRRANALRRSKRSAVAPQWCRPPIEQLIPQAPPTAPRRRQDTRLCRGLPSPTCRPYSRAGARPGERETAS
jgi:hypothetical protein